MRMIGGRAFVPIGILLCVVTLAGCDNLRPGSVGRTASMSPKPVPRIALLLPIRAQLSAPVEPDCEFKTTEPNTDDRQKLDYERQCYRHAAMIARERLRLLQSSVRRMARAADRCQWYASLADPSQPFDATGALTE